MKKKELTLAEVKQTELYKKYKELTSVKKQTAFSRPYYELNDLKERSQASACNIVLDYLILREKVLTLHELALLMLKDQTVRAKVRKQFIEKHIEFRNKTVEDSCKRLIDRHVINDTPTRLGKRAESLT